MAGPVVVAGSYAFASGTLSNGTGMGYDRLASVLTGPPGYTAASQVVTPPPAPAAGVAVPAPSWQAQPRRPGASRARAGMSLVAAGVIGTVAISGQPPPGGLPRVPHPAPHRAIAGGVRGTVNLRPAVAGTSRIPHPAPRRVVWRGVTGPGNATVTVAAASPRQLPPVLRRRLLRAVWHGNANPFSPVPAAYQHPPRSRVPVPPRRAIGKGIAGPSNQSISYAAVPPPAWRPLPPRRGPVRAIWRGVTGANRAVTPPPGVQPRIGHPRPQRAVVRGVSGTTRAVTAAPLWHPQPRRANPLRAFWRGSAPSQPTAAHVAVPAPKLLPQPPRRAQLLRAAWRAIHGQPAAGGLPLSPPLLAGTITQVPYAGTVTTLAYAGTVTTMQSYAGTITTQPYGGTITPATYGGTITTSPYAGTITGGIVGVQSDLQAIVGNDSYFYLALTYNGAALNLTGYTVKAYLKATRLTPDADAVVFTSGSGLTITNVAGGLVTWDIPHADLPSPSTLWYRFDVIDASSEVFTALYGNLQVQPA